MFFLGALCLEVNVRNCRFAILVIFSFMAEAGEVEVPNHFVAGEKAVADEVNQNFQALMQGVNDNDSRISNSELAIISNSTEVSKKQNEISGSCAIGSVVIQINSDGTVVCSTAPTNVLAGSGLSQNVNPDKSVSLSIDPIQTQKRLSGACDEGLFLRDIDENGVPVCDFDQNTVYIGNVDIEVDGVNLSLTEKIGYFMVPAADFNIVDGTTTIAGGFDNPYLNITGGKLAMVASLGIPEGGVITGLSMRVWDFSETNFVTVELRKFTGTAITEIIASVSTTDVENSGYYVKEIDQLNEVVSYSGIDHPYYYLVYKVDSPAISNGPGIYAVRVTYRYIR